METLTREQAVWAAGMGISIDRARCIFISSTILDEPTNVNVCTAIA